MSKRSPLHEARLLFKPELPAVFAGSAVQVSTGAPTQAATDGKEISALFPKTYGSPMVSFSAKERTEDDKAVSVGVILSGGQAPGGHNVMSGLFDALKAGNKASKLFGFLGGPSGILDNDAIEITDKLLSTYRNTGGFDIIGSGRTKLETTEQFDRCIEVCKERGINALVIIGGDDSNTNAALLAEYFAQKETGISVIGAPKTIDGDLKNESIETSFGFDTATKTYSELIGNIQRDANSAKKYWHFIKLMGRSASHIALECALQTQPNITIVSEEVLAKNMTLNEVVDEMARIVIARAKNGENFGVALIPEGLVEFIPEIKSLIAELNDLVAHHADEFAALANVDEQIAWVEKHLSAEVVGAFTSLPKSIQSQLLAERDPHGNVQVSLIETEKLLSELVAEKVKAAGHGFKVHHHFFGYEGRCAFPSNFDANYCYALGQTAYQLIASGLTGYLAAVKDLVKPVGEWQPAGVPITMMMNMEQRHGEQKPVIKKALVELEGGPFKAFVAEREKWAIETSYLYSGAIQYYGPREVSELTTQTLVLESNK